MKLIYSIFLLFLMSCVTSGFKSHYVSLLPKDSIKKANNLNHLILLKKDNNPSVVEKDISKLSIFDHYARDFCGYEIIGRSFFNDASYDNYYLYMSEKKEIIDQAKKIRATHVLFGKRYKETETYNISVPKYNTVTHEGNFSKNTSGDFRESLSINSTRYSGKSKGTYSGTSTYKTYENRTIQKDIFLQQALYLAQLKKPKSFLGFRVEDLSGEDRDQLKINLGLKVFCVIKNTPAFEANLIRGDVITEFNGVKVKDEEHFDQLLKKDQSTNTFKILRNNQILNISFNISNNRSLASLKEQDYFKIKILKAKGNKAVIFSSLKLFPNRLFQINGVKVKVIEAKGKKAIIEFKEKANFKKGNIFKVRSFMQK